jgi:hypothetical protein
MARTITQKAKGDAKERSKDLQPAGTKERKKPVPLMVRSYLTHVVFNVACVLTMRFNSNARSPTKAIFLSIPKKLEHAEKQY